MPRLWGGRLVPLNLGVRRLPCFACVCPKRPAYCCPAFQNVRRSRLGEQSSPGEVGSAGPRSLLRTSSRSFCTACGPMGPSSTGQPRRPSHRATKEITGFPPQGGKSRPCWDGGVVRSSDFLHAPESATALSPLFRRRRLTPSCGGRAPSAHRTVGRARMIMQRLTPRAEIREQNRPEADDSTLVPQIRVPVFGRTLPLLLKLSTNFCQNFRTAPANHQAPVTLCEGQSMTHLALEPPQRV